MPPKRKGRATNKKKNKGGKSAGAKVASQRIDKIENVPTFHGDEKLSGDGDVSPYERYKQCTSSFRDWLESVLPEPFRLTQVVDLSKAADEIYNRSLGYYKTTDKSGNELPIVIPPEVMHNLNECIQLREKVSMAYADEDKGHRFMIETLNYCRRMLGFSRNVVRVAVADSPDEKRDQIGGRFNALLEVEEDEQEEAEADMEAIRSEMLAAEVTKPTAPEREYTIDDLINGDDRFQACSFITTMNDLMHLVEQHYGLLKRTMREEEKLHESSSFLQLALECAVAANMAMESVSAMETQLAANHPHLESFYDVLALVFLYPLIADMEEKMGRDVRSSKPNIAKIFAGDIVECSFRNKGDINRFNSLIGRFARDSTIPESQVRAFAETIKIVTDTEASMAWSQHKHAAMLEQASSFGVKPHTWLEPFVSLGGNRSFLNTQNLVQSIMDIVGDSDTKLQGKPGFFGALWDEDRNPATTIHGDMDEVFAGEILPELIETCRRQPISALPNRQELIPLLDIMSTHLRNRKSAPVPASLTFGLQTILLSMFLLQGNGDVNRLAVSCQQSYDMLFDQLEQDLESERPQPPMFKRNLKMFGPLRKLPSPVGPIRSASSEMNAFWNPVMGGEFMLYGTYIASIGLGSVTVDTLGQLRFTLHLYNALKACKLIEGVEFLDSIDRVFSNTKAVWVGGRPDKGSFAKNFWLAWGCSFEEANRRARSAQDGKSYFKDPKKNSSRTLEPILPEQFSASYRRLVKRDFSEDCDDYSVINATVEQRKAKEGLFDVLSRLNFTRDSMDADENTVMPTNFTRLGCILIDFILFLSKTMGWEDTVRDIVATCPNEVRNSNRPDGRRVKIGGFETSDMNLTWQALAIMIGNLLGTLDATEGAPAAVVAATNTKAYFVKVPKERFTFTRESEANAAPDSSNPLLGAFPPGRTGRTPRDPLAAFFHFKYSKRGVPVVRLIKPGPRTPFILNASLAEQRSKDFNRAMHIQTPYKEEGSKLKRQSNGRYRHIASFSQEELRELGWDGAKYCSNGNHAAKGMWVPFVCGYDSDADDRYDPIDVAAGKRAGTIGLRDDEVGLYMDIPQQGLVRLQKPR